MDDLVTGQSLSADNFGLPFRMHADPSIHMLYVWQYRLCVCLCVWLHAASVRQTALFEVAGTGALTAWQAPAGYWPTDGAEGEVCWGDRGDCRVEGWELEEGGRGGVGGRRGGMATVGWGSARSGNWHRLSFSYSLHDLSFVTPNKKQICLSEMGSEQS